MRCGSFFYKSGCFRLHVETSHGTGVRNLVTALNGSRYMCSKHMPTYKKINVSVCKRYKHLSSVSLLNLRLPLLSLSNCCISTSCRQHVYEYQKQPDKEDRCKDPVVSVRQSKWNLYRWCFAFKISLSIRCNVSVTYHAFSFATGGKYLHNTKPSDIVSSCPQSCCWLFGFDGLVSARLGSFCLCRRYWFRKCDLNLKNE